MSFSIAGMVQDASSGVPLTGATVRLVAAQNLLGGRGGAQPTGRKYTWSRVINGGDVAAPPNNFRFTCYQKFVQPTIPASDLSQQDFIDGVLDWNPNLNDTGKLFVEGKFYFIPTEDGGPELQLTTTSDGSGNYHFDGLTQPGVYGFIVENNGYVSSHTALQIFPPEVANQNPPPTIRLDLKIAPQPPSNLRMRTLESDLNPAQQRFVECAINLITDDERKAYDFLPQLHPFQNPNLDLQPFCTGWLGRSPDLKRLFQDKDIVCADLPSFCYAYAFGHGPQWTVRDRSGGGSNKTNPHCANYYYPANLTSGSGIQALSGFVPNLPLDASWRPGDLIVFWAESPAQVQQGLVIPLHVNVYVGKFAGTDLDGRTWTGSVPMVVNTSLNDTSGGIDRWGPKVATFPLANALQGFGFHTIQHVRLTDLQ